MKKGFDQDGQYKPKHAMHMVRLLLSGLHALRSGEILVDVGEHREELLTIRRGEKTFAQVQERAQELEKQFQEALPATVLPEKPDEERVDQFLIRARFAGCKMAGK
jgi:hypothetical protein